MVHTSAMTVAVTGATGFVGRHTVRALVERGHRVRALARDAVKARAIFSGGGAVEGVEVMLGDVFEPGLVADLCRGAHAVVHVIGIRKEVHPSVTFERMHVQATRRVLDAAVATGVRRVVHVSAMGTGPESPTAYGRSKFASERLVRTSGLDWTIFRPGLIHGADSELMRMIKGWVLGRLTPHFFIPYFARVEGSPPALPRLVSAQIAPVSVGDVASVIASSLETPRSIGEVYPLAGPEAMRWPELLALVRDALPLGDRRKRIIPIPGRVGWLHAQTARVLGLANSLPFGPSEPILAMEDMTANCAKAAEHLGFIPRPCRASVREYADRI